MGRRTGSGALAVGLALIAGLTALDIAWGPERVVIASVVLAPFVTAFRGQPRPTMVLGLVAVAVCLVSPVWNENAFEVDYVVRLLVVGGGATFAVLGARSRERMASDGDRFRLLAAIAELGDTTATVDETVRRVDELLVPDFADACVIDVERDGHTERLAVTSQSPDTPDLEALDRSRRIAVDLRARGTRFGTLSLVRGPGSGRRFSDEDHDFARILSGRVALALDNAGLSSEVESLAARLSAALGGLAEAVTIQDRSGRLVYANEAAARALGFASSAELLATPPQAIVGAFESFHDDGSPLELERLPGRRVLAGEEPEPLLIRAIDRATGEERWRLTKATAVLDREGRPVLAVNVIEDVTEAKRAELTHRFLAAASQALTSSLDYEETLERIARLVVPELADWCAVSMPDGTGRMRAVAVAHIDPAKVELAREYNLRYAPRVTDPVGSPQVLREGVSQVLDEIPDELLRASVHDPEQLEIVRSIGMRAAMIVPMVAASGVVGVISFVSAESGRRFTPADLSLAEELGRRAGAAVENARLYTERSRIAHTLQMSLLPDRLPDIPGFAAAALYRPAGEESFVGGDFYDAFATHRGWMILIGDVTGRGAEAAALTAQARHTLRTAGTLLGDPVAALDHLNRSLVGQPDLEICTAAVVLLTQSGEATVAHVACAGHPPPLLVRGADVRPVGEAAPMLGAWTDVAWSAEAVELVPGDVLVLYTDGVTDAVGVTERFGDERLAAAVRGADGVGGVIARVRSALHDFEHGEQADDTAVLALQRLTAPVVPGFSATSPAGRAAED